MSIWFNKAFSEFYPILYAHYDDAMADRQINQLIKTLHLKGDEQVLDVCCGAGRHLSALLARGYNAWGTDLSQRLLKEASTRPDTTGRIVNADIRLLSFKNHFDVVFNLFTSFGYFIDDSQNEAALAQMVAALRPGGKLVIDHINRSCLEQNLVKKSCDRRAEFKIVQQRRIIDNRVIKDITIIAPDGFTNCFTENIKLFYPDEIRALFEKAGLMDVQLFGSFEGVPLEKDAERMIVVGQKGNA